MKDPDPEPGGPKTYRICITDPTDPDPEHWKNAENPSQDPSFRWMKLSSSQDPSFSMKKLSSIRRREKITELAQGTQTVISSIGSSR